MEMTLKNYQNEQKNFLLRKRGDKTYKCFKDEYIKRIFKGINLKNELKIVWDSGNGAAGELMSMIAKKISDENFYFMKKLMGIFQIITQTHQTLKILKIA